MRYESETSIVKKCSAYLNVIEINLKEVSNINTWTLLILLYMQLSCHIFISLYLLVENNFHEVIESYQRRLSSHSSLCHRGQESPDGNCCHSNHVTQSCEVYSAPSNGYVETRCRVNYFHNSLIVFFPFDISTFEFYA